MTQKAFWIGVSIFSLIAILANWIWEFEYILATLLAIASVVIVSGFFIGVWNMIKDENKKPE